MFLITVLFLNAAKTKQELDSAVFQTAGIAQKFNCTLNRLDYMQEQGLMSSLPLANNLVPIKRALTTTSTAIFVPFTTQELFMEGDSLYYGLNAVSNNMIMADRKQLKNPNGLILGTPGSGKSFSAKREMTNVFFTTTDDIIIADPEGEYARKKILDYLHKPLMEKPMNQKPSLHQMEHYQKFYENGEYVRAVESTTEQNYNMIDGCANNLPKPRIINGRESVLDKLRIRQMAREKQKSSQEQSADMERNRK